MEVGVCAYLLSKDLNNKEIKLKTNNRLLNAKIVGEVRCSTGNGETCI